jgi:hypothetical protein
VKIVFHHDSPLPVKTYGGIERMLFWHMKELVIQGHKVCLIGHQDSQLDEYGIELIIQKEKDWYKQIPKDSDLIQLFYNYTPPIDIPCVQTIGGNGKPDELFTENTVFVSQKHAANHGSDCFIYNALDFDEYPYRPKAKREWENFLFLAKASWKVKNLKHSVKACKKTKKHLHIAGGRSLFPNSYIHNYGMVGGDEKLEIIRKCDAHLFPVRWHEPFGLAVIEAMAQGLPVIASPYGSLPELIENGTGIIVSNTDELERVLKDPPQFLSADEIREYAQNKFSIQVFTNDYIKLFEKVLRGEKLNKQEPCWNLPQKADELLPF